MGGWGIASSAPEKEKIKSEFADFINGLNSVGEISYSTYSELFDEGMLLLDKMYALGTTEGNITSK